MTDAPAAAAAAAAAPTPAPAPSSPPRRSGPPLLDRLPVKLVAIVATAMALLVPLGLIADLTREREARREEAVAGIQRAWGGPQRLIAPLLLVPAVEPGATSVDDRAWIAVPATRARIDAALDAEPRARGIFSTVVYRSAIGADVAFERPAPDAPGVAGRRLMWDEALLAVPLSESRGLGGESAVAIGGVRRGLRVRDGLVVQGLGTLRALAAPVGDLITAPGAGGGAVSLRVELSLRGGADLRLVALAREAEVRVHSRWPHPSFHGGMLPDARRIGADGFEATWRAASPGLPAALAADDPVVATALEDAQLGVAVVDPVPTYRMVERAQKYDLLLIAFTFLVFFLFEALWGARLHVVHYALVGAALCLFYLLLLSFAEILGFAAAYGLASALVVVQASLYGLSLLRARRRAAAFAALLAGAYAYFYVLLMLESHALVAGALALFGGLSALMYVTRAVEWGPSPRAA